MTVDPHERVSSTIQDDWVIFAEKMYGYCLKIVMEPKLTPEEVGCLLNLAIAVRMFNVACLCMDDDVESTKAKLASGCWEHHK